MKLYLTERSGNAYKARLLLSMLGVAYEKVPVDLAGGEQAGRALRQRVLRRELWLHVRAHDSYGRALGNLWLGEADLSAWLVSEGHAWSARHHRHPGPYAAEEQAARAARRGLFAEPQPETPREFRRRHGPCIRP